MWAAQFLLMDSFSCRLDCRFTMLAGKSLSIQATCPKREMCLQLRYSLMLLSRVIYELRCRWREYLLSDVDVTGVFLSLDCVSGTLCLSHYMTEIFRLYSCDARLPDDSISCPLHHCWLTDTPSLRFLPYVTSASTLIPICRCGALPHYEGYVVNV